ncbi:hydrolase nit2 [Mucor ambiguus]|uniref:Hydrolase nit2 n=1 Tax=Mucor ambiguus TaxID=91626 RepID=A0A0C9M9T0_9FUNG|nr:hydrolase nit2 [Mucor ambiguus]
MPLAAVGQFCATASIVANKSICIDLIKKAARQGASMIFLPEASDFISRNAQEAKDLTTTLNTSEFIQGVQNEAAASGIWVSVGVHESTTAAESDKIYNTHVLIDSSGTIKSAYRKIHLFDVDIAGGPRLVESDTTEKGDTVGCPEMTPLGKLGLQTCYDMRFSEASIALRARGAELLAYPSAFTIKTGMAHWEVLLRSRAIETQTYVIAAAQIGQHNEKRASYGNAMIVDPWGTVLARCPDTANKPSIAIADIDLDYLARIRTEMPVMNHRRTDLYPKIE